MEEVLTLARQKTGRKATVEEVLQKVCTLYGLEIEEVMAAGKKRGPSEVRAMVCWLVREERHLSLMDLSKRFKRVISGLSKAASRLVEKAKKDRMLATKMAQLNIAIELLHTLRANAVTEFHLRMVSDIVFDLIPITFVIPNLFECGFLKLITGDHLELPQFPPTNSFYHIVYYLVEGLTINC